MKPSDHTRSRASRRSPASGEPGFTLLEVMVALAIGAMVMTSAAGIVISMERRVESMGERSHHAVRDSNVERMVRSLFANLDTDVGSGALVGDAGSVQLKTWCDRPEGWLAPCAARLSFDRVGSLRRVRLDLAERHEGVARVTFPANEPGSTDSVRSSKLATPIDLWSGFGSGKFVFLEDPSEGGTWVDDWARLQPPPGVGVVLENDTLFVRVWGVA